MSDERAVPSPSTRSTPGSRPAPPACCASSTESECCRPADVHVAERIARLVGEAIRGGARSRSRSRCADRGSATCSSTSRRSPPTATVESEEPVDLSTLAVAGAEEWVAARARERARRRRRRARRRSPLRLRRLAPVPRPLLAGGAAGRRGPRGRWRRRRRIRRSSRRRGTLEAPVRAAPDERQRAARRCVTQCFAVIAGGPGTGKTTTVARIVALLGREGGGSRAPPSARRARGADRQGRGPAAGGRPRRGRDARTSARRRARCCSACADRRCTGCSAGGPGSHSRFAHDRENRLPHDLVIVDETSMISLSLMARLVEAVRPDARLILVGDPGQLTSIEAGVVLGDIVGSADAADGDERAGRSSRGRLVGGDRRARPRAPLRDGDRAPRRGDPRRRRRRRDRRARDTERRGDHLAAGRRRARRRGQPNCARSRRRRCRPARPCSRPRARAPPRRAATRSSASGCCAPTAAARTASAPGRREIQAWLADAFDDLDLEQRDYVGRPLLITENDYELGLYNGDTGRDRRDLAGGALRAMFERGGEIARVQPDSPERGRDRVRDDDP